jgi:nicotinic acid mononucleotide adenylyltransferase
MSATPWWDSAKLLRFDELLRTVQTRAEPAIRFVDAVDAEAANWMSIAVLAGSFNPLTRAHELLAAAALEQLRPDRLVFALSTRTVDKERVTGAALVDRLLCLKLHDRRLGQCVTAVLNRGLYVDQARLFQRAGLSRLTFVVGFDKIVQIFDPRYYADRNVALDELFGLASFAVAPRERDGKSQLDALLARSENRPYSQAITYLSLDATVADDSSTELRSVLQAGQPIPADAPIETRALVAETGVYRPPAVLPSGERVDRYALRVAALDALSRGERQADADLASMVAEACQDTEAGRAQRCRLLADADEDRR